MNQLPSILSYEIKHARTGEAVPVVNGVHLHSIYNPMKEAISLIDAHLDNLKKKNEVVILGLGFGYHVNYLIQKLKEFHGENYKVIIIEPNLDVYRDCINQELVAKNNVLIYAAYTTSELYSDQKLVHYLLRKPAIIAHGPSFNLYQEYYKSFLTFSAPTSNKEIISFIENETIKTYLKQFSADSTLEEVLANEIVTKTQLTEMDMVAMALWEMTKASKEVELGESK